MKKLIALLTLSFVLLISTSSLQALTVQTCGASLADSSAKTSDSSSPQSVCSDACGIMTWNKQWTNDSSKCLYTRCGCKP